jgi:hypothetical protein
LGALLEKEPSDVGRTKTLTTLIKRLEILVCHCRVHSSGAAAMVRNRSVGAVISLLAMTCVSTPSRANDFLVENDTDLANRSAYLNWMAQTQVNGLAAPIAIANQPCYVYEGPNLVVLPCPGTVNYVRARY